MLGLTCHPCCSQLPETERLPASGQDHQQQLDLRPVQLSGLASPQMHPNPMHTCMIDMWDSNVYFDKQQ